MRVSIAAAALSALIALPAWAGQEEQAPRPFPEGAKIAYVDLQRVASESEAGRASAARVTALNEEKAAELNSKNTALQASQQKLQQGGTVLSDAAVLELQREIQKMQIDIQRFTEDAQVEVQSLQQELQFDFQVKLLPVIEQVAIAKGLHFVFTADSGIVWADRGLDITADVISQLDAGASSGNQQDQ